MHNIQSSLVFNTNKTNAFEIRIIFQNSPSPRKMFKIRHWSILNTPARLFILTPDWKWRAFLSFESSVVRAQTHTQRTRVYCDKFWRCSKTVRVVAVPADHLWRRRQLHLVRISVILSDFRKTNKSRATAAVGHNISFSYDRICKNGLSTK